MVIQTYRPVAVFLNVGIITSTNSFHYLAARINFVQLLTQKFTYNSKHCSFNCLNVVLGLKDV